MLEAGCVTRPFWDEWTDDDESFPPPHQLAKIDVTTREHIEWKQESCFPSEPVFVASPGAVEEDDGEAFTAHRR